MSSLGVTLWFGFGRGGAPEVALVRDLAVACPVCGWGREERRFEATPFHSLTVGRLRERLDAAPPFDGVCEQCDERLTEAAVTRWAIRYGLHGGVGTIEGFATAHGARSWRVTPRAWLDGYEVPAWIDDGGDGSGLAESLTEAVVRSALGRPLSAKQLARRRWTEGEVLALSDGLVVAALRNGDPVAPVAAALDATGEQGWIAAPLSVGGTATAGFAGAADGWFGDVGAAHPDLDLWGLAPTSLVTRALRDIVARFPVESTVTEAPPGQLALSTPGDADPTPLLFDAGEIAYEAARTLADPRDVTRLELDRALLGATGLWTPGSLEG
ncbi:MAG: hypothetical protein H6698_05985 [Myxococcales bacterium]|nr:hypothetical protein [Myxococcales bacterium]MCB9531999.1 hypothetical protein [Myxococcales bacterium]MCB9533855.1 hypothetical protein [Myxococcales bacterium]